jgi:phospholipid/cholesterol/gamma-HCH transport system ATP-binding protein
MVLNPEVILVDEPDSGLDPVRTTYISQLFLDVNAATDATFLIVTHNINMARTVPDNLGMLFRRELVMFGPREVLLSSEEPVVKQFLNGRMNGPIGMSEEKDAAQMAAEQALFASGHHPGGVEEVTGIPPQMVASPGMPERRAIKRRRARVMEMLHTLPPAAQQAIRDIIAQEEAEEAAAHGGQPQAQQFAPAQQFDGSDGDGRPPFAGAGASASASGHPHPHPSPYAPQPGGR